MKKTKRKVYELRVAITDAGHVADMGHDEHIEDTLSSGSIFSTRARAVHAAIASLRERQDEMYKDLIKQVRKNRPDEEPDARKAFAAKPTDGSWDYDSEVLATVWRISIVPLDE